jgi:hypothetical protein
MAKAVIIETDKRRSSKIRSVLYSIARPKAVKFPRASVEDTLPFRIRFTSITVPGYGPNNVPGIGLQVIGFSNYIL